jgi:uncharacterized protein
VIHEKKTLKFGHHELILNIDHHPNAGVTLLLGHGWFNNHDEPLLSYLAEILPQEPVTVIRFDFPFAGKKTKGLPLACRWKGFANHLVQHILADERFSGKPLFLVGKSLSGRIFSYISNPLVKGLIFLGYPLRYPGFPFRLSNRQLRKSTLPLFFIQGGADGMAPRLEMEHLVARLHPKATLMVIPEADHSLQTAPDARRTQAEIHKEISEMILWFCGDILQKKNN